MSAARTIPPGRWRGRSARARRRGWRAFDSVQPRYNLLFRQIERELLPLCLEEGIGVIPYNPLAGGFLSGKHRREAGPTAGTRFTLGNAAERYQERYWHEREFATVEALRPLAAAAGMSMAQMAVAWVLAPSGYYRADHRGEPARSARRRAGRRRQGMPGDLKARLDEMTRSNTASAMTPAGKHGARGASRRLPERGPRHGRLEERARGIRRSWPSRITWTMRVGWRRGWPTSTSSWPCASGRRSRGRSSSGCRSSSSSSPRACATPPST